MEDSAIGRQLRARRTAAGRTVASVAADAGLSVPYIANLENGRGNPTAAALRRLAEALDLRLVVTLTPDEPDGAVVPEVPPSLVRLAGPAGSGRRRRPWPRRWTGTPTTVAQLVVALAALAQVMGRDLAEPDWWRLLDALLLIAVHPSAPVAEGGEPRGSSR